MFKAYEIISQQIEIEYSLINNRLGWYVTSQAFLLTAFGVWTGQQSSILSSIAKAWFPGLGIVASFTIFMAIYGATCTIQKWMRLRESYIDESSSLGKIVHLKRWPGWHWVGLVTPLVFPLAFLSFWVFLLCTDLT